MKPHFLLLGALCLAQGAEASPCAKKIAALDAKYGDASGGGGLGADESVDAKLHHQPSASSVGDGASSTDAKALERQAHFAIMLEQAKAAEAAGDTAGCESAVAEARKAMGR